MGFFFHLISLPTLYSRQRDKQITFIARKYINVLMTLYLINISILVDIMFSSWKLRTYLNYATIISQANINKIRFMANPNSFLFMKQIRIHPSLFFFLVEPQSNQTQSKNGSELSLRDLHILVIFINYSVTLYSVFHNKYWNTS